MRQFDKLEIFVEQNKEHLRGYEMSEKAREVSDCMQSYNQPVELLL
jgi:ribosome biogenesis protein Tsr3